MHRHLVAHDAANCRAGKRVVMSHVTGDPADHRTPKATGAGA
jgi:hypothetical protein